MDEMNRRIAILDCQGCGVCCMHMGYPAFNLPLNLLEDATTGKSIDTSSLGPAAQADSVRWLEMPEALRAGVLQAINDYLPPTEGKLDKECLWLDSETRLCNHHTFRPQVCRDFETGCDQCIDWRQHYHNLIQLQE